ncbi:helix-turn-helix transcriptional regulator [Dictyobacter kobayashii]|uniref:Transcriptional regulator n=1 Tax=Dictyobacter kobayashii TaxID=2014872 RepID=A0A402ADT2_9CHLR|nr:YafY family protein [Dictyobacter kobayashii]GCE17260.1 transcriptional regulator [Dictyobacter kobayashii]
MYHPSTRLLTILDLLQMHPYLSGEELARRLEVEPRTVRRYIGMLQDMGMPIEGSRGPGGGYKLRPGFKLPPLLFTEEEATAVVLGLLGTSWLEIELSALAVEGALAKVYRILPARGRQQLQAISSNMMLSPHQRDIRPEASLLVSLSEASHAHLRITIEYSSHHNQATTRTIEPYGIAGWKGHWYLVGYCLLRQSYRTFRLDRIRQVQILTETFVPAADFNYQDYILKHLITVPEKWLIEVEFQAELHLVQHKIPSAHGKLTQTPTGVLFQSHHIDLPSMARYLMNLDLPFVIHQPPELRAALLQLAENMIRIATAGREDIPRETGLFNVRPEITSKRSDGHSFRCVCVFGERPEIARYILSYVECVW